MRRRKRNEESIGYLIVFGFIVWAIEWIIRYWEILLFFISVIFLFWCLFWWLRWYLRERKRAKIHAALLAAGSENPMQLTPEDYEQFCAALLANNGWSVRLTGKTGDFGADVIADKSGHKVVVQCKQWSNSVGVKAVQEAHTAMSHYRADQAIVVTTSGYTRAAKDLAESTGVRLLSHTDLVDM
ncbi:restriction endonuclease [Acidihalobacter aeolianus]|uniref:restriction endonuclease n=1 Tax=Acidihalobacter aeolianus TaxID=2792603 RepID=UPI0009F2E4F1|nr:restriction endonuclease [Acidihalobacter aeolianus]